MKHHDLRCDTKPFQALKEGVKKFEIRRNDRAFEVGDLLTLHETRGPEFPEGYTGLTLKFRITYILEEYGLSYGFVALGLARAPHRSDSLVDIFTCLCEMDKEIFRKYIFERVTPQEIEEIKRVPFRHREFLAHCGFPSEEIEMLLTAYSESIRANLL